jgi:hypothetical protein
MSDSVLITIIVQLAGFISFFGKSWLDKRVTKKEVLRRDGILQEKISGIGDTAARTELKIVDIEKMLSVHISDNDFQILFKNVLQNKNNDTIKNLFDFNPDYINIMSYWTDSIERFGLKFYYSTHRKKGGECLETFLKLDMDTRILALDKIIDSSQKGLKYFKKEKLFFSEFVRKMNFHADAYVLVQTLVRNGLTPENTVDLFEKYLTKFYNSFFTAVRIWDTLPDFNYKDDV